MINSNVETIFKLVTESIAAITRSDHYCFSLCDNEDLTIEQLIVVATTLVNTVSIIFPYIIALVLILKCLAGCA
jgi:hypothetical protein